MLLVTELKAPASLAHIGLLTRAAS